MKEEATRTVVFFHRYQKKSISQPPDPKISCRRRRLSYKTRENLRVSGAFNCGASHALQEGS